MVLDSLFNVHILSERNNIRVKYLILLFAGTATVSIFTKDVNDNDPDFNAGGYVVGVNQYHIPGNSIGSITATDLDSGNNAEITYTGTSVTGSTFYTVTKTGAIYLNKDIDFEYGTMHRFMITAVDNGSPKRTASTTADIVYQFVTTTTTTTAAPINDGSFWDEPGNIALVAIASLLALIALAILLYYLLRKFCCKG